MKTPLRSTSLLLLPLLFACGAHGVGSSDTGGGVPPETAEPSGTAGALGLSGLLSAVGGPSSVRLDWVVPGTAAEGGEPLEVALFQAADPVQLLSSAPSHEALGDGPLTVTGLADGAVRFFQLGVREPGGTYEPFGSVLSARPGQPIYVDPDADPAVADGASPATAYADLTSGLLVASLGDGIVWARGGDYGQVALPLLGGVHFFGGFGPDFDLATRDPAAHPTVLHGALNLAVIGVQGTQTATLDGVRIEGDAVASVGIDVDRAPLEVRGTHVQGCTSRGIRLRGVETGDPIPVTIVDSSSVGNGADGLSGLGAFDLRVFGSSFDENVQEGLDFDDFIAPDGGIVTLEVVDCSFTGNGTEGLDADLSAPLTGGGTGGLFRVRVNGSRFERNGSDGMIVDLEFETTPIWTADIAIVGCEARANRGAGVHFDLDSGSSAWIDRVVASANGAEGILVGSETAPGLAVISSCVAAGNLGAGIRAFFGNRTLLLSHCVLAGNLGGGAVSEVVESSAASCVAFLQPAPFVGVRTAGCAVVSDPFGGAFENVPEAWLPVSAANAGELTSSSTASVSPGAVLELADDGVARTAATVGPTTVTVTPAPTSFSAPGVLAVFAPGAPVLEDYRLPPGSELLGAGMAPPGGPAVDPGPWGSPQPGDLGTPGLVRRSKFRVAGTTPELASGIGANDSLFLAFEDGTPDPASLGSDVVRAVDSNGAELNVVVQAQAGGLVLIPPGGGWGALPVTVEVHGTLRSTIGDVLTAPVALPLAP